jgi:hypothetical protein
LYIFIIYMIYMHYGTIKSSQLTLTTTKKISTAPQKKESQKWTSEGISERESCLYLDLDLCSLFIDVNWEIHFCVFSIYIYLQYHNKYSLNGKKKSCGHSCMDSYLGHLFCSTYLYVYFFASNMLFLLLWIFIL